MFFRILRQSFFEGRKRKILAAITVALAATLITALLDLSVDVGDKMAREMKSYGANIRVVPKSETVALEVGGIDYNPLKGRDYLDESDLPLIKDIFWRNNIVGLAPFLRTSVEAESRAGQAIPLIGTYFDKSLPLPDDDTYRTGVTATNAFWAIEGAWPDDTKPEEVLLGRSLARALNLAPGATLRVHGADGGWIGLHVTGLLSTGGAEDDAIVAPLALAQRLTGLSGRVQAVEVSALTVPENELSNRARRDTEALSTAEYDVWYCTAYVSAIAHQIEEAVVNASARPIWQVAAGEGAIIGKIQLLMLVVTLAAFVSAAMGVSSLMNATIMERAREIGLMKALGAATWEIHMLFLGEAVIVGVIGGLIGCALGTGLSQAVGLMVFGSTVSIPWIGVPVVVFLSAVTALAGSIIPSRAIARLLPVEVLYGRR
ncbi:ABC transporter permease [Shumkonia mesophila]|uniref:ABC transporter permease n=1 Tax=Shumkonia mesophila TaxID=2838854 RepID=UPI0029349F20|nr:ABC transporter permease [Shumkonia mesophila]